MVSLDEVVEHYPLVSAVAEAIDAGAKNIILTPEKRRLVVWLPGDANQRKLTGKYRVLKKSATYNGFLVLTLEI